MKQSALHPHALTAKRMAQIEKWRTMGAQAKRGRHIVARSTFHNKRAKRGTSVTGTYAKAAAWGIQKMVVPVGFGAIGSVAKNRIPGYNQYQIAKTTSVKSGGKGKLGKRRGPG